MNLKFKYSKTDKLPELEQFATHHLQEYHRVLVQSIQWTFHFSRTSINSKRHQELTLTQKSGFAFQKKIPGDSSFKVSVDAQTSWGHVKGQAHAASFEQALQDACAKVEKQILKMKSQLKDHKKFPKSKAGQLRLISTGLDYQPQRLRKSA